MHAIWSEVFVDTHTSIMLPKQDMCDNDNHALMYNMYECCHSRASCYVSSCLLQLALVSAINCFHIVMADNPHLCGSVAANSVIILRTGVGPQTKMKMAAAAATTIEQDK